MLIKMKGLDRMVMSCMLVWLSFDSHRWASGRLPRSPCNQDTPPHASHCNTSPLIGLNGLFAFSHRYNTRSFLNFLILFSRFGVKADSSFFTLQQEVLPRRAGSHSGRTACHLCLVSGWIERPFFADRLAWPFCRLLLPPPTQDPHKLSCFNYKKLIYDAAGEASSEGQWKPYEHLSRQSHT